jgi:hypothetical protein
MQSKKAPAIIIIFTGQYIEQIINFLLAQHAAEHFNNKKKVYYEH